MDVPVTSSSSATVTIESLRQTFATHGLPDCVVSDNATAFTGKEFHQFMNINGIKHLFTAPYHAHSNGLAERAVQTFKQGIKRQGEKDSIQTRVSRFLCKYRLTHRNIPGRNVHETTPEILYGLTGI